MRGDNASSPYSHSGLPNIRLRVGNNGGKELISILESLFNNLHFFLLFWARHAKTARLRKAREAALALIFNLNQAGHPLQKK